MGVITLTVREPRHDQVAVRDETVTFARPWTRPT